MPNPAFFLQGHQGPGGQRGVGHRPCPPSSPGVRQDGGGGVIKMTNNMAENEHKRRRTDSPEGSGMSGSDARRGRHDPVLRGEWSHSEVSRGRGRGEWRARGRAYSAGSGGRAGTRSRGDGGYRYFWTDEKQ
jgi:hypothetical protein